MKKFHILLGIILCTLFLCPAYAHANAAFNKAYAIYPVSEKTKVTAQNARNIVLAYGPAAKKGSMVAMLLCMQALEADNKTKYIYPFLQYLENVSPKSITFSPEEKSILKATLPGNLKNNAQFVVHSLYVFLGKLHLLGLGTAQSYDKAYAAIMKSREVPIPLPLGLMNTKYYQNPHTIAAQEAFWDYVDYLPNAEIFILNRVAMGDTSPTLREDLYQFLRKMDTLKQREAFLQKHKSDQLVALYGYEWALLQLQIKSFSPENMQEIQKLLAGSIQKEEAQKLLALLPQNLQNPDQLEQLLHFVKDKYLLIPRWLYAYYTIQVDSGILDKPLTPKFSYLVSGKEQEYISSYRKATNKENYLSNILSTLQNNKIYAFKFEIYKDLSRNHPKILEKFQTVLTKSYRNNTLAKYPPYLHYKGDEFTLKALGATEPHEKEEYQRIARQHYYNAAKEEYPPAMARYAKLELENPLSNKSEDFEMLIKAARMGNAEAFMSLTRLPHNGVRDKERELSLLTRAANLGNAEAVDSLQRIHSITIDMDPMVRLAHMVQHFSPRLMREGEKLFMEGKSKEDVFLGAILLWYTATYDANYRILARAVLSQPLYTGTILPQDIPTARTFYMEKYRNSGFRGKHCGLVLPIIEMMALGLGGKQYLEYAQRFSKEYAHCKSPWAQEILQKDFPIFTPSPTPREGYASRFTPSWKGWKTLSYTISSDEMQQIKNIAKSNISLMEFLLSKKEKNTVPPKSTVNIPQNIPPDITSNVQALRAPAPKKPGVASILPSSSDSLSLTSFTPDQKADTCVAALALSPSPLVGVRMENISGIQASWKTKDVKNKALGVLALWQGETMVNAHDTSFALDVSKPSLVRLCVQDNGTLADPQNRLRIVFSHQDGSRSYAIIVR